MRYPQRVTIAQNIEAIRERIAAAAARAGRDSGNLRLVGVTKGVAPARVQQALDAGLRDFGENFLQEAQSRIFALGESAAAASWHFIGHLQTNKAAAAADLFAMIHSVDSVRLAEQLSRRSTASVRVLLEVNVAGEASKFGFAPAEVGSAVARIGALPRIDLAGLMTVAPASKEPETARPIFRELRDLASANGLSELSMGMTDDFEVAIEEGATIVRIGRAIFGERPV
jgi:pyridoxal phosphate enzyme (YggS family)